MGTRNIRIRRSQVAARLPELSGKTVHIILQNGRTYSGEVISATVEGGLSIRDHNAPWTSRKRHTHKIDLDQVIEVILDTVTDF
ncbi:MAG TPA: hypothetical protein ENJ82_09675 [Bacteroidetes bacterium]|nr:hypothetical protein [Bacteroidota bacterium]